MRTCVKPGMISSRFTRDTAEMCAAQQHSADVPTITANARVDTR
jgi:hypothetical protein